MSTENPSHMGKGLDPLYHAGERLCGPLCIGGQGGYFGLVDGVLQFDVVETKSKLLLGPPLFCYALLLGAVS